MITFSRLFPLIRKVALIIGFFPVTFFIFFLIGEGFAQLFEGRFRVLPVLILMILSVSGYIMAWRKRYKAGGLVMVSGGLAMSIFLLILGGFSDLTMAMIFSLSFVVPGFLFIISPEKRAGAEGTSVYFD